MAKSNRKTDSKKTVMNIKNIRNQFPVFQQKVNGYPFIYFDSASTAQVPGVVIDAMASFYESYKSNVGRGIYSFAELTTQRYEDARKTVADFIGAQTNETVFTSGTTAGINMVAQSWARQNLKAGDEIVISDVEHHSNFVPWQELAREKNLVLKTVPVNDRGVIDPELLKQHLTEKTGLVALFYTSNLLGTTNDVQAFVQAAHAVGARVLIDAAQAVAHRAIDVKKLECDFLVFSGHKLFGPTGIGVLYLTESVHSEIKPCSFGGGMVFSASIDGCSWKSAPHCFEAGTPLVAQAIGLGKAVEWLQKEVIFDGLQKHETALVQRCADVLAKIDGVTILSHVSREGESSSLITFYSDKMHAHDIAAYLDAYGIAVRAGNHCVQPYHDTQNINATVRLSFSVYNSFEEVNFCLEKLQEIL